MATKKVKKTTTPSTQQGDVVKLREGIYKDLKVYDYEKEARDLWEQLQINIGNIQELTAKDDKQGLRALQDAQRDMYARYKLAIKKYNSAVTAAEKKLNKKWTNFDQNAYNNQMQAYERASGKVGEAADIEDKINDPSTAEYGIRNGYYYFKSKEQVAKEEAAKKEQEKAIQESTAKLLHGAKNVLKDVTDVAMGIKDRASKSIFSRERAQEQVKATEGKNSPPATEEQKQFEQIRKQAISAEAKDKLPTDPVTKETKNNPNATEKVSAVSKQNYIHEMDTGSHNHGPRDSKGKSKAELMREWMETNNATVNAVKPMPYGYINTNPGNAQPVASKVARALKVKDPVTKEDHIKIVDVPNKTKATWEPLGSGWHYTTRFVRRPGKIVRTSDGLKVEDDYYIASELEQAALDAQLKKLDDEPINKALYKTINMHNDWVIPEMTHVRYLYWVNNDHMLRAMDLSGGVSKDPNPNTGEYDLKAKDDSIYFKNTTADLDTASRRYPKPEYLNSKRYEGLDKPRGVLQGKFVRMAPSHPKNADATQAMDTWNMVDGFIRAGNVDGYNAYLNSDSTEYVNENSRFGRLGLKIGYGTENPKIQSQIIDKDWVQSRFMTPNAQLAQLDRNNRYFSTAGWKYTCTRLGYHLACNPRPQFTRTADIKGNNKEFSMVGFGFYPIDKTIDKNQALSDYINYRPPGKIYTCGMGRYYSEAIDDNATTIMLQFGVPKFNSLISFFTRAVSYVDMVVATRGRVPTGYKFGRIIGEVFMWRAFPICTAIIFVGKILFNFFFGGPFKYYYMQPTMHTYWTTVSQLVTQLSTELGILSPVFMEKDSGASNKIGVPVRFNQDELSDLAAYFPTMFSQWSNFIDIYAVATQEQKLARARMAQQYDVLKKREDGQFDATNALTGFHVQSWNLISGGTLQQHVEKFNKDTSLLNKIGVKWGIRDFLAFVTGEEGYYHEETRTDGTPPKGVQDTEDEPQVADEDLTDEQRAAKKERLKTEMAAAEEEAKKNLDAAYLAEGTRQSGGEKSATGQAIAKIKSALDQAIVVSKKWWEWFNNTTFVKKVKNTVKEGASTFDAVIGGAGEYAVFNVDYPGSLSDSFGSSYSEIQTGGVVKSVAQGARDIRFNLAGGSLGSAIDTVKNTIVDVLSGVLDSVTFGLSNVLRTITGGAYVEVPKKWDDSEFNRGSVSYTIDLVSPYANTFSQLQNIYIPLCMLLAGTLPLRTGEASYTSPFLCSVFDKGVQDIQLGMITSLTVERGITNLSYTKNKKCLSYRVSFTVTDFGTRLTAPVNASLFQAFEGFNMSLEDDSPLSTYLATIASRDLYTAKYIKQKMKQKLSRFMMAISRTFSPNNASLAFGEWVKQAPVLGMAVSLFGKDFTLPHTLSNNNSTFKSL